MRVPEWLELESFSRLKPGLRTLPRPRWPWGQVLDRLTGLPGPTVGRCSVCAASPSWDTGRVQRNGLNHGGYHGERIDLDRVLAEIRAVAAEKGFAEEILPAGAVELVALKRPGTADGPRIYLSAGIHGDEPASVLAMAELLRRDPFPPGASLWICPCLNPSGNRRCTRENAEGVDLNRDYKSPTASEVTAHVAWLRRQPGFDLHVCLHEDWESNGFYLYEVNPDGLPSRADAAVAAVRPVCPVDDGPVIDGREVDRPGVIHPPVNPELRPEWPEAFWLLQNCSRHGYTLEGPSDWPMAVRVQALVRAVESLLAGPIPASRPPISPVLKSDS